jgi:hypothetical protein
MTPRVKPGGRYRLGDGHVVVDAIEQIDPADITPALARESGFESVEALLAVARHGLGTNVYLIRFHYLRAGAWDTAPSTAAKRVQGRTRGRGAAKATRARRR